MQKRYKLQYTEHAKKDLLGLEKALAKRIVNKIAENISLSNPLSRAKKLSGELSNVYRYRVGNYRILFDITEDDEIVVLMILRIKHRKEVYRI